MNCDSSRIFTQYWQNLVTRLTDKVEENPVIFAVALVNEGGGVTKISVFLKRKILASNFDET